MIQKPKTHTHLGFLLVISLFLCTSMGAQEKKSVNWITFEQLEDSLAIKPKKVFIDFYTDWCTYCRKMDKVVFTKSEVINLLNTDYYAVRFDAETELEVTFGSKTFINDQVKKSRNPVHQIAQLLATKNGQFLAPTLVILDKDFKVTARYFEYMDSKTLLKALNQNP
ncbi:thioredoxin fold domain-containing protein [Winogradskyella sp.]|uniref:thioredoxin family protein n=1 Tax=Winogradskyella sp. TaxID=1883156 RepID=UPI00260DD4BD|nr:thioredoxin fold domain-containing protein [Winogradskyella sp.]